MRNNIEYGILTKGATVWYLHLGSTTPNRCFYHSAYAYLISNEGRLLLKKTVHKIGATSFQYSQAVIIVGFRIIARVSEALLGRANFGNFGIFGIFRNFSVFFDI